MTEFRSPEYQETVTGKKPKRRRKTTTTTTESNNIMRTVRIICRDPDMTDSSDDDGPKSKTIVREIKIPMIKIPVTGCSKDCITASEKNLLKPKKVLTRTGSQPQITSGLKYRGVRLRESGNWAAEIRDPFKKTRVWLGTFRTPQEASQAYEIKKLEFEKMAEDLKIPPPNKVRRPAFECKKPVAFEETVGLMKHASPSSVLEKESRIFINDNKKMESFNDVSLDVLSDFGCIEPADETLSLAEMSKDLDLGLELGAQFLDNLAAPLDAFWCIDDFKFCGVGDAVSSNFPDLDLSEWKTEERDWISTLRIDDPLIHDAAIAAEFCN